MWRTDDGDSNEIPPLSSWIRSIFKFSTKTIQSYTLPYSCVVSWKHFSSKTVFFFPVFYNLISMLIWFFHNWWQFTIIILCETFTNCKLAFSFNVQQCTAQLIYTVRYLFSGLLVITKFFIEWNLTIGLERKAND